MLRWLTSLFSRSTHPTRVDTSTPAGSRVRGPDGIVGTLTGVQEVRGDWWGRVVYIGHNTTWIDQLPLASLELS